MDAFGAEALAGLTAVLNGLLPAVSAPLAAVALSIIPTRITSPGLGNYIGLNDDPLGSLFGVRLLARVQVAVDASSPDKLDDAVTAVMRALVGSDSSALRQR